MGFPRRAVCALAAAAALAPLPALAQDVPAIDIPAVDVPDVTVPGVEIPDVPETPDVDVPDVEVPDVEVPDVDVAVPDVEVPDVDVEVPDVDVPDVDVPAVPGPDVDVPDPEVPEVDVPDTGDGDDTGDDGDDMGADMPAEMGGDAGDMAPDMGDDDMAGDMGMAAMPADNSTVPAPVDAMPADDSMVRYCSCLQTAVPFDAMPAVDSMVRSCSVLQSVARLFDLLTASRVDCGTIPMPANNSTVPAPIDGMPADDSIVRSCSVLQCVTWLLSCSLCCRPRGAPARCLSYNSAVNTHALRAAVPHVPRLPDGNRQHAATNTYCGSVMTVLLTHTRCALQFPMCLGRLMATDSTLMTHSLQDILDSTRLSSDTAGAFPMEESPLFQQIVDVRSLLSL